MRLKRIRNFIRYTVGKISRKPNMERITIPVGWSTFSRVLFTRMKVIAIERMRK